MNTRHCVGRGLLGLLIGSLVFWGACKREEAKPAAEGVGTATAPASLVLPPFDESALPFGLQTKIGAARREALRASDDVNKVADLGALCYAHGFPQVAVACFQSATKLAADDPTWWYYLGLACERAGDMAQATTAYEKALALKDDFRLARTRLVGLMIEKDRARAAETLRHVLTVDSRDVVAHAGLGFCMLADGKLDEAAEHFDAALQVLPKYGPAHAGLAKVLNAQGKTAEAVEHQRRAAGDERLRPVYDPSEATLLQRGLDLEALLDAVVALTQRREYAQAELILRDAIDVDEAGLKARTALGDLYGQQGKFQEAISEFEHVLAAPAGQDYAPAKILLAAAMMVNQNYDRAESLLHEVLAKQPDDRDALRRLCRLAAAVKAPEKAMPALEAALVAAPRDAELHTQVGEWLAQFDKHAEAEAALRKAIELQPDLALAHFRLGLELNRKGPEGVAGAREEWAAALRLDPRLLAARLGLMQIAATAKNYAEMERLLREGVEVTPGSADLANALAWLLATCPEEGRRNGAQAIEWADKACQATKYGDHAMVDTLAAAYAAAGRFDDAKKWIAEAIKLAQTATQPEAVKEYEARQELYAAGKPFIDTP